MNSSPDPNKTIEQAIDEHKAATLPWPWPGWGGMVVGLVDPVDDVSAFLTDAQQLEIFGCLANEN